MRWNDFVTIWDWVRHRRAGRVNMRMLINLKPSKYCCADILAYNHPNEPDAIKWHNAVKITWGNKVLRHYKLTKPVFRKMPVDNLFPTLNISGGAQIPFLYDKGHNDLLNKIAGNR